MPSISESHADDDLIVISRDELEKAIADGIRKYHRSDEYRANHSRLIEDLIAIKVGRSVMRKVEYLAGAIFIGLVLWAIQHGFLEDTIKQSAEEFKDGSIHR